MKTITSDDLFEKLKTIISLPEGVISFTLELEHKQIPVVTIQREATGVDDLWETTLQKELSYTRVVDEQLTLIKPTDLSDLYVKIRKLEMELESLKNS